jgi:hypothetical protein
MSVGDEGSGGKCTFSDSALISARVPMFTTDDDSDDTTSSEDDVIDHSGLLRDSEDECGDDNDEEEPEPMLEGTEEMLMERDTKGATKPSTDAGEALSSPNEDLGCSEEAVVLGSDQRLRRDQVQVYVKYESDTVRFEIAGTDESFKEIAARWKLKCRQYRVHPNSRVDQNWASYRAIPRVLGGYWSDDEEVDPYASPDDDEEPQQQEHSLNLPPGDQPDLWGKVQPWMIDVLMANRKTRRQSRNPGEYSEQKSAGTAGHNWRTGIWRNIQRKSKVDICDLPQLTRLLRGFVSGTLTAL